MSERLFDLWRRQFIAELEARRNAAAKCAEGCAVGGWYRGQVEQSVAMYQTALDAVRGNEWMWEDPEHEQPSSGIVSQNDESLQPNCNDVGDHEEAK